MKKKTHKAFRNSRKHTHIHANFQERHSVNVNPTKMWCDEQWREVACLLL